MLNRKIIMRLYHDRMYRQILAVCGYRLIFDKSVSEIFTGGNHKAYLSAYVFRCNDISGCKVYSVCADNIPEKAGKKRILANMIMKQVIENEIMML